MSQTEAYELLRQHEELQKQHAELLKERLYLQQELDFLKRQLFGRKSERYLSTDLPLPPNTLFNQTDQLSNSEPLENLTEKITYTREKPVIKKGGRKSLPEHLHREVIILEPENKGDEWHCIGKEITEELEYKPGVMYVNRFERPKYKDPHTQQIHIAPIPLRVVDKCIAGPQLMSHVLISKYIDHMPYYRQLQGFKRMFNVKLSKSTFGDWAAQYADELEILFDALSKEILNTNYLQIDESPFKVQSDEVDGKCHLGYMWVCRDPQKDLVLFSYQHGRGGESLKKHIKYFKGMLQCDGWKVYEQLEQDSKITLISCWAHARRYFEQSLDSDQVRSEFVLNKIQELYNIERHCRDNNYNIDQRHKWRQEYAVSILNSIKEYLDKNVELILPDLAIGKAFGYALKRWDKLIEYVNHGEVEIDNNLVENAIRPLALGKKNYLFAGSEDSAHRAATMYSLLGTCKLHNVNPYEWLSDVFNRLGDYPVNKIHELLPHNWIKRRAEIQT